MRAIDVESSITKWIRWVGAQLPTRRALNFTGRFVKQVLDQGDLQQTTIEFDYPVEDLIPNVELTGLDGVDVTEQEDGSRIVRSSRDVCVLTPGATLDSTDPQFASEGFATADIVVIIPTAECVCTGFPAVGADDTHRKLIKVEGSFGVTLDDESAGEIAEARFDCPNGKDYELRPGERVFVDYPEDRWEPLATSDVTGFNVGSGVGVFRDKTDGDTLNLRGMRGVDGTATVENGDDVDVRRSRIRVFLSPSADIIDQSGWDTADEIDLYPQVEGLQFHSLVAPSSDGTTEMTVRNRSETIAITIPHESSSGTALYRFACPQLQGYVLAPGESVKIKYTAGAPSRWWVLDRATAAGIELDSRSGLGALGRFWRIHYGNDESPAGLGAEYELIFVPGRNEWIKVYVGEAIGPSYTHAEGALGVQRLQDVGEAGETAASPNDVNYGGFIDEGSGGTFTTTGLPPGTLYASPLRSDVIPGATPRILVTYGRNDSGGSSSTRIMRSDDGGFTWATGNFANASQLGATCLIWTGQNVVAGFSDGTIEYSTDNGQTFSDASSPTGQPLHVPISDGQGTVVLVAHGSAVYSTDNGESWAAASFAESFSIVRGGVFFEGVWYIITGDNEVHTSSDGISWTLKGTLGLNCLGWEGASLLDTRRGLFLCSKYMVGLFADDDTNDYYRKDFFWSRDGISWTRSWSFGEGPAVMGPQQETPFKQFPWRVRVHCSSAQSPAHSEPPWHQIMVVPATGDVGQEGFADAYIGPRDYGGAMVRTEEVAVPLFAGTNQIIWDPDVAPDTSFRKATLEACVTALLAQDGFGIVYLSDEDEDPNPYEIIAVDDIDLQNRIAIVNAGFDRTITVTTSGGHIRDPWYVKSIGAQLEFERATGTDTTPIIRIYGATAETPNDVRQFENVIGRTTASFAPFLWISPESSARMVFGDCQFDSRAIQISTQPDSMEFRFVGNRTGIPSNLFVGGDSIDDGELHIWIEGRFSWSKSVVGASYLGGAATFHVDPEDGLWEHVGATGIPGPGEFVLSDSELLVSAESIDRGNVGLAMLDRMRRGGGIPILRSGTPRENLELRVGPPTNEVDYLAFPIFDHWSTFNAGDVTKLIDPRATTYSDSAEAWRPRGDFDPSGYHLVMSFEEGAKRALHQYHCATPLDDRTKRLVFIYDTTSIDLPGAVRWGHDGTYVYWQGTTTATIYQYDCGGAYEMSGGADSGKTLAANTDAFALSSDGSRLVGLSSGTGTRYDGTPGDLDTFASALDTVDLSAVCSGAHPALHIALHPGDDEVLFVGTKTSTTDYYLHRVSLAGPAVMAGAVEDSVSANLASAASDVRGIGVSYDGQYFYLFDRASDSIVRLRAHALTEDVTYRVGFLPSPETSDFEEFLFRYDADHDSYADTSAGKFGALTDGYDAETDPTNFGTLIVDDLNVSGVDIAKLLQTKASIGAVATIRSVLGTAWHSYLVHHTSDRTGFTSLEVTYMAGDGSFVDEELCRLEVDARAYPPAAEFLTSVNPFGNGFANSFTTSTFNPSGTTLQRGDVLWLAISNFSSEQVAPSGEGWVSTAANFWGPTNSHLSQIWVKMWGIHGLTDDDTTTFGFEGGEGPEETDFAYMGGVIRGVQRLAEQEPDVRDTAAEHVDAQPYIVTGIPRVTPGGVSLRVVVARSVTGFTSMNDLAIVTDGKAFDLSGSSAFKFSQVGANNTTHDYFTAAWVEAHPLGGRVQPRTIGPQMSSASVDLVQLIATFRPKRNP